MYTHTRKNLPKHTIEFEVTFPWEDIQKAYDESFETLRKDLAVEGFRKGNVPKKIAEGKIQKSDIYDHLLRDILPKAYGEIIKKDNVKPIVSPKIELKSAKENEAWVILMRTAETPTVALKGYKEAVQKAKGAVKSADIWVPGKGKEPTKEEKEAQKRASFQASLEALLKTAHVDIPDILIEEEAEQRLARLVDDVTRVGLTMEAYLKSKNLTKEKIQEQIRREIEDTYKTEFILQAIADAESISIEKEEIDKLLDTAKDDKEKKHVQENMYYYASLLRKQKVLDFINSL